MSARKPPKSPRPEAGPRTPAHESAPPPDTKTAALANVPSAEAPPASGLAPMPRVSRHVQPLGPRVLIRVVERPDRLDSGLFLPATAKEGQAGALVGEVIEVARTQPKTELLDEDDDDHDPTDERASLGHNVSGIPVGATVLVPHDRGITVPWDNSLRLVEVRHVLAIVEEIPEERLQ